MTNFATLADRYGSLKAEIEALTKQLDAVKGEILEAGAEEFVGTCYTVSVGLSERTSLDTKKAKAFLTPAQVAEASVTQVITTVRVRGTARVEA